jgi:hypothetical protein
MGAVAIGVAAVSSSRRHKVAVDDEALATRTTAQQQAAIGLTAPAATQRGQAAIDHRHSHAGAGNAGGVQLAHTQRHRRRLDRLARARAATRIYARRYADVPGPWRYLRSLRRRGDQSGEQRDQH